ncbi:serine/threonine-protein kinase [Streptomyces sp. H10-C2]|uniref:serine/threonine-protein kinase n=1 Tax=unclassified Streptomyces TaxID=2593676 RepID=UPI0024B8FCFD|nr:MULTISPECIES: serine/threonine-protein kinase [unclassified Streptomyces]MDJ0340591.1 serine/threonine-protein kinase [Streptomyces sp. PH10-H1]MDJ0370239.1 serine/threonine-protein kinase [Streptomyces sp. H10-C2]
MVSDHADAGRLVAGRYRLVERIGRGGMGTVWRAEDELLGRQVAVKKLHPPQPHLHEDELATIFERTRREARAAARISHPNVIVVHDVVDDAGLPSIVMEYVPSMTLGEVLKKDGALPPEEAARVGRGMVAALRAAHRAGVLHRDVKPGNVLLGEDGRVVLTDFGIAQASGNSTLTRTGELIGSIDFLSPERIKGLPPGPEADLWALGATLYQAVEGRSPFRRDTAIETAYAISQDPVLPALNAGPLEHVIARLLAKEPSERMSAEDAERLLRLPAAEADTTRFASRRSATPSPSSGASSASPAGSPTLSPNAPHPEPAPLTASVTVGHGADHGAHHGAGPGDGARTGTLTGARATAPPRRRRKASWLIAALTVVAVAAGGTLAFAHFRDGSGSTTGSGTHTAGPPVTATPSPSPSTTAAPPPLPKNYRLVTETGQGFSVPVPKGWKRSVVDGSVNYIDPTGLVGLKFNVLDYASPDPVAHFTSLESVMRTKLDGYHQERMQPTSVFGQKAAIWQFTFKGSKRDYRAIDLGFGKEGGREYAIYLSAPKAQWDEYKPVFDNVVAGFRQSTQ